MNRRAAGTGGDRREPAHGEIEELLGAYALDAVDAATAAMIEHHLESCVRCSVEVANHHEVAGLLANSGGESSPEVWDGIAARLAGSGRPPWERLAARLEPGAGPAAQPTPGPQSPAPGPGGGLRPGRRTRRWVTAGAVVVAAAAALVAVLLGVRVDRLDHQVSALAPPSSLQAAERAALAEPSTRSIALGAPAGSTSTARATVVLTASGTGFVRADRLSALPTDRTYQLWGVVGGETISLGLLGPDPTLVPFSVAGEQPVRTFAITDERSGGVVASTHQPVVAGGTGA